jgi:cyclopropane fatty-acyl-phospholipid synthase-like methyltransferase
VSTPTDWWEDVYRNSDVADLPWYTPSLDPDFDRALKTHLPKGGRLLDLGTGPATQAIALAKRGYEVVATDIAPSAIAKAKHAAERAGVRIDFRVDNILESRLPDAFVDAIVDRGVFHTLAPESRAQYVARVHRILRPHGFLVLKAFSDKEPRQEGPYHFAPADLRGTFERSFDVLTIEDAVFHGPNVRPPKALIAVFRRR